MREQTADDFSHHHCHRDDKTDHQHRFVVGAIVVLMTGMVVMTVIVRIVIVSVWMVMMGMFVRFRCFFFQRQRGVVDVTVYAAWLGVEMFGR